MDTHHVMTPAALAEQMDRIYRDLAPDEIPWNLPDPPELLVRLIESGQVAPGRAVDLGCGAGNYAVWLATKGFRVTGVDVSPAALEIARRLAAAKGVACDFMAVDLLGDIRELVDSFDFAYDWEVLHHILPAQRQRYVANVHRILRPGARYLSVCFSQDDPGFGGTGKARRTPLGTTLYFSSEQELTDLFAPFFIVDELSSVRIAGRREPHVAVKALLTKIRRPARCAPPHAKAQAAALNRR